jgi:hypothetical protein
VCSAFLIFVIDEKSPLLSHNLHKRNANIEHYFLFRKFF